MVNQSVSQSITLPCRYKVKHINPSVARFKIFNGELLAIDDICKTSSISSNH